MADNKTVNKHRLEADRVGLTLVGPGRNSNYRTYRCNKCGSEQEIQPGKVRLKSFKCQKCFTKILEKESHEVRLTLIGAGRNAHYRTYRFNDCGHEQEITTGHVRKGNFRCRRCKENKHDHEADPTVLKIIGPGTTGDYRTYRFIECGHEQEFQPGHVRAGRFRCGKCLDERLETESQSAGLTIVGPGTSADYRIYRFNECGHEQELFVAHVRRGNFRCGSCHEEKLNSEARAVDLTLLGPGKDHRYRIYRFRECGHEQEIITGHVREGNFRCGSCHQEKLNSEAKAVNLTLLGPGKDPRYRSYRFNECGHEQQFQTGDIRRNNFLCSICEKTARDLPSNVYLLKIKMPTFEWVKIGYARDVASRIKQYGLLDGAKVSKIIVRPFETGREAHQFEESIHIKYGKKRVAVGKMKKFHTRSGFDECYPTSLLEILSEEILKKQTS